MVVLTQEQADAAMAVNQTWPYRGQEDGWFLAHGGLRLDMADLSAALKALAKQSSPPNEWQRKTLGAAWEVFSTVIHHHHKNEEDIAFPYVATRAELPAKMAADHKALVAALEECAALVGQVVKGSSTPETLAQLIPKFDAFAAETEEHLVEEEEGVLPAMRHFFTPAEWKKNVEEEILKNAKPRDLGWLLRQKPAVADKKAWMRQVAKLPGPVISLVMMPAINGFERDITRPMQQLISGATVPEPAPGCACSIM